MGLKSILSYPGGKQRIADKLIEKIPDRVENWYEPFFGGGSVTLNYLQSYKSLATKHIIVADKYEPLINFWKVFRQDNFRLYNITKEILEDYFPSLLEYNNVLKTSRLKEKALEEGASFFNLHRANTESLTADNKDESNNSCSDNVERAAKFFLRNKMSFSGTTDSGGMSDACVLRFNYHRLEPIKNMELYNLVQRVEFNCCDYTELFKQATENDFLFLDPPYFFETGIGMYGEKSSTHKGFDHLKFKSDVENLKSKWLLTYGDRVLIRQLYKDYAIEDLHISYSMCRVKTDTTLDGAEVLISNLEENKNLKKSISRAEMMDWL